MKLAYISPLNPIPNGLSDYSEALLPSLSHFADITVYSDCGTPSNSLIAERFVVRPIQRLIRYRAEHDVRLYQIGNSPDHASALDALRRLPGVVTLHEPFLHHGFLGVSPSRYRREVFYELGQADRNREKHLVDLTIKDDRSQLMETPLIGRLLDISLGIIVHSQAARSMLEEYRMSRPARRRGCWAGVIVIPHLMPILDARPLKENRQEFALPPDALIFGIAGTMHSTKEPHWVLRAFARVAAERPNAYLVLIGAQPADDGLLNLARSLGVAERLIVLGRLDPLERLHRAIAACDVLLNLRRPTIGETSGTALRTMALGRPLIVRDVGWYSELPDAACVKIAPAATDDDLSSAMLALGASTERRERLGAEARRYIQSICDVSLVARRYAEFLSDTYNRLSASTTSR